MSNNNGSEKYYAIRTIKALKNENFNLASSASIQKIQSGNAVTPADLTQAAA